MAQIQYKFNKNDEYLTPPYAVYPIMKRLRANTTIWCPFDMENSQFVKILSEHGFSVIYSHIKTGQDFFLMEVITSSAIPHTVKKAGCWRGCMRLENRLQCLSTFRVYLTIKKGFGCLSRTGWKCCGSAQE